MAEADDLWQTLGKYGLEEYTDPVMDMLEAHGAIPEDWYGGRVAVAGVDSCV